MKELFFGFLGKTLNMPADQIAALVHKQADDGSLTEDFAEDALDKLLQLDSERVKTWKQDTKSIFDNGYKKGQKEALENLEKQIREEFKIADTSAQGIDLVKQLAQSKPAKPADDDLVKTHPLYLSLEKASKEQAEALRSEYEQKINDLQSSFDRQKRFEKASQAILSSFEAARPVLPTSATAAAVHRTEFVKLFQEYDFDFLEDGKVLVKDRDGKRVEDAHGHPRYLDELVRDEVVKRYDIAKQETKPTSGNTTQDDTAKMGKPGSEEEFYNKFYSTTDPAQRKALFESFYGGQA